MHYEGMIIRPPSEANSILPQDKEKTLELISQALRGNIALKPESMRAL